MSVQTTNHRAQPCQTDVLRCLRQLRQWGFGWAMVACLAAALPVQAQSRAAQAKGIELDALLRLFLIPKSAEHNIGSWAMGAEANTPINWLHAGIVEADPDKQRDYTQPMPYSRSGEAIITVNRKPTHEVLGRQVEPGKWNITLYGPRAGPFAISLTPQTGAHDIPDLKAYLKKKAYGLKHLKCMNEPATSGNELHRLSLQGRRPVYLQYGWSYGSGGGTQYIDIAADADMFKTICFGD